MKEKIEALIAKLESEHDFEDEFYVEYTQGGDISDWHNNHFDDNVELGYSTGQTAEAESIIGQLKQIIGEQYAD